MLAAGGAVMALPRVAVLLSTFNGAAFLSEQLASLGKQHEADVFLHARDDCSQDDTVAVLRAHADRWPELARVESGENLGVARSFFTLLATAPHADYFAFCDQDDVWLPDKLARAVAAIAREGGPALYCSNVTLVDENLAPFGNSPAQSDTRLAHLLFENIAIGCTVVLNRAAREVILAQDPGEAAVMHDWWCALVIAALGHVHYDPQSSILYRQHGKNVVGQRGNALTQAAGEAVRFLRGRERFYRIHRQSGALLALYGPAMRASDRGHIERLVASKVTLGRRLAYALAGPVVRRRRLDALVVRCLIAAGWY